MLEINNSFYAVQSRVLVSLGNAHQSVFNSQNGSPSNMGNYSRSTPREVVVHRSIVLLCSHMDIRNLQKKKKKKAKLWSSLIFPFFCLSFHVFVIPMTKREHHVVFICLTCYSHELFHLDRHCYCSVYDTAFYHACYFGVCAFLGVFTPLYIIVAISITVILIIIVIIVRHVVVIIIYIKDAVIFSFNIDNNLIICGIVTQN